MIFLSLIVNLFSIASVLTMDQRCIYFKMSLLQVKVMIR